MVTIKFCDYGFQLSTRTKAIEVSSSIIMVIEERGSAVLDLNGVQMVSLSFSDELFGRLIKRYGFEVFKSKTHFINVSSPVGVVISSAIKMNITVPVIPTKTSVQSLNLNCI